MFCPCSAVRCFGSNYSKYSDLQILVQKYPNTPSTQTQMLRIAVFTYRRVTEALSTVPQLPAACVGLSIFSSSIGFRRRASAADGHQRPPNEPPNDDESIRSYSYRRRSVRVRPDAHHSRRRLGLMATCEPHVMSPPPVVGPHRTRRTTGRREGTRRRSPARATPHTDPAAIGRPAPHPHGHTATPEPRKPTTRSRRPAPAPTGREGRNQFFGGLVEK